MYFITNLKLAFRNIQVCVKNKFSKYNMHIIQLKFSVSP